MAEVKEFTLSEVAPNTGRDGQRLWIIYKDDVLDVTDFLYEHPGGADEMLEVGGADATKAFDAAGHSGEAIRSIAKYKIGVIVEAERRYINGKKIVKPGEERRSCLSIVTCGLLGG